jgi:hypothetical protein|tara:strand:- start:1463 stop:2386 length:924 start_codon:yes stop_codon:yes gene_type:complete
MIIKKYPSILLFLLIIVSCERDSEESIDIQGCTVETACNYDSSATIDDGSCVFADQYCNGDCDYTHFESLPSSLTILSGDSCLYNPDISVLDSIIGLNGLEYDSPLEVGTQTWYNGRLRIFVAGNYGNSSGVNDTIYFLPDNIGDWTELVSLYLEWNRILTLPESFSDMTSLINLYINNNVLSSLPDNLGNLENLYFLDLGYNELPLVPESICNLGNLTYLWLFNNNLESVPECMCEMDLDWNNNDLGGYPYFAIGANMLCDNVDSCVAESEHFELSLDQFYYSFPVYSPQVCDSTSTALNKNPILY